jgi:hypothetical protein
MANGSIVRWICNDPRSVTLQHDYAHYTFAYEHLLMSRISSVVKGHANSNDSYRRSEQTCNTFDPGFIPVRLPGTIPYLSLP